MRHCGPLAQLPQTSGMLSSGGVEESQLYLSHGQRGGFY